MANDRVFLVCQHCSVAVYLAKWMTRGWYRTDGKAPNGTDTIGLTFEEFMDKHEWCGDSDNCTGSAHVELVHEGSAALDGAEVDYTNKAALLEESDE